MFKTDYFTNKQMAIRRFWINTWIFLSSLMTEKNLHPFPLKSLGVHTQSKMLNFAWSGLKVSQLGVTNTHSIRRETYHFNWLHTRTGAFLKFLKKNLSKWVHHREVFSSAFNLVTLKLPQVIGPLWSCPSQVSCVGTSLARHLPHSPFCTLSCSTSTSLL